MRINLASDSIDVLNALVLKRELMNLIEAFIEKGWQKTSEEYHLTNKGLTAIFNYKLLSYFEQNQKKNTPWIEIQVTSKDPADLSFLQKQLENGNYGCIPVPVFKEGIIGRQSPGGNFHFHTCCYVNPSYPNGLQQVKIVHEKEQSNFEVLGDLKIRTEK